MNQKGFIPTATILIIAMIGVAVSGSLFYYVTKIREVKEVSITPPSASDFDDVVVSASPLTVTKPVPQKISSTLLPSSTTQEPALTKKEDKPPVLKNLGIKIEPWNKTTNMAGDILFENKNYIDNKIFTEFGHKIVNEFGEKLLPEIAFNIPVGTKAVSPIDGIITDLRFYEPSQDYLILIKTDKSSSWIVGFEHIYNNMNMKVGDRVFAGQEIAESSPSYGRTEYANFEVNVWTAGQNIIKYCPYDFLEESLKPIYKEKINQLAMDWEEFIGQDVYKQENWIAPGCLMNKIIER